jgi:uncharacterized OsmC-like protein
MNTMMQNMTNGVDTGALVQTVEAIQANPEIAKFQFRARNQWMGGGHNRSTIQEFYGACQEDATRTKPFVMDADEPPVLLSQDCGANPVEYLLHALAACMTTSMVYHAAARGLEIEAMQSKLEGDLDLRGFLGLSPDVRKGYQRIRVCFQVKTQATAEQLRACAMFSPVYDVVSRSVPVDVDIQVER